MNGKLNKYKSQHKIILGDFNCVMDNNLDIAVILTIHKM